VQPLPLSTAMSPPLPSLWAWLVLLTPCFESFLLRHPSEARTHSTSQHTVDSANLCQLLSTGLYPAPRARPLRQRRARSSADLCLICAARLVGMDVVSGGHHWRSGDELVAPLTHRFNCCCCDGPYASLTGSLRQADTPCASLALPSDTTDSWHSLYTTFISPVRQRVPTQSQLPTLPLIQLCSAHLCRRKNVRVLSNEIAKQRDNRTRSHQAFTSACAGGTEHQLTCPRLTSTSPHQHVRWRAHLLWTVLLFRRSDMKKQRCSVST
jgi:hypothetical protein